MVDCDIAQVKGQGRMRIVQLSREAERRHKKGRIVVSIMLDHNVGNVGTRNLFKRRLISGAASRETEKPKLGVKISSW